MKKIILGLFLILGAVSFAVPSFIDATKLQKSGHDIIQDEEGLFTIGSPKEDTALVYSYVVVPKKQKLGKYKIYATYATVKKLPKDAINSTVKSVINEAEGLIK